MKKPLTLLTIIVSLSSPCVSRSDIQFTDISFESGVANLRSAYLVGADLVGADLRGADLRGADLTDVDLRFARLDDAKYCKKKMPWGERNDHCEE